MSERPECPTCGEVGVRACVDENGRELDYDHEGRPPYFDARATAALNSMSRRESRRAHQHDLVPVDPKDGARFLCRCGYSAEFIDLGDGQPGEWVDTSPPD